MQKRILFIICILFNVLAFAGDNTTASGTLKLKTVVIDAGHGGHDPGALGKMSQEKNITLAVALKLGELIKKNIPEVKVIYTRSTDVFVELRNRADIANKNDADLFISIHVNSNPNTNASGVDTWVMGQYKTNENFQVAKEENKVILAESNYGSQYEGFDPNSTESYIIFNLMQNAFIGQSLEFASGIQNQVGVQGRKDRGVESAPFLVLWKTTMPSVLIETGFISNANDEKLLVTDDGQNQMANIIYSAFKEYKIKVDSRTKLTVFDQPEETKTATTTATTNKDPFKTEPSNNKTSENSKETAKPSNLTASIDNHQSKEQPKTDAIEKTTDQLKTISKEFPKVESSKDQKTTTIKQDAKPTIASSQTKESTKTESIQQTNNIASTKEPLKDQKNNSIKQEAKPTVATSSTKETSKTTNNTTGQKTPEQSKPIVKESTKTESIQQTNSTASTKEPLKDQKNNSIKQEVKPTVATSPTKETSKTTNNTTAQKTQEQSKPVVKESTKTEHIKQTNSTATTKEPLKDQKNNSIKQEVKPTIAISPTKETAKTTNNTTAQKTPEQSKPIVKESAKTESIQQTNNTASTKEPIKDQKNNSIKQDVKPTVATTQIKEPTKVTTTSQKTVDQVKPVSKEFPKTETTQQTKPEYPKQTTVVSSNTKPVTVEKNTVKTTTNIKTQSTVDTNIVQFSIQILSSSKRIKLDSSIFKGENKVRELKYAGAYKYLVGNELEYNNIVLLKNKVKINFPDAFIVSTKNGRRIPIAEALVIISKK